MHNCNHYPHTPSGDRELPQRLNQPLSIPRPWIMPNSEYQSSLGLTPALNTPYSAQTRLFRAWPTVQSYFDDTCPSQMKVDKNSPSTGTRKSFWTRYNSCGPQTPWGAPQKSGDVDIEVDSCGTANSRRPLVVEEIEAKIDFGPETPPTQNKKVKMVFSSDEKMVEFKDKLERQISVRNKKIQKPMTTKKIGGGTRPPASPLLRCAVLVSFLLAVGALGIIFAQILGFSFNQWRDEIEINVCGVMTSPVANGVTSFDLISKTDNPRLQFVLAELRICSEIQRNIKGITDCKLIHYVSSTHSAKLNLILDVLSLKQSANLMRSGLNHESLVRFLRKVLLANRVGSFQIMDLEIVDASRPKLFDLELNLEQLNRNTELPSVEQTCKKVIDGLSHYYDPLHSKCTSQIINEFKSRVTLTLVENALEFLMPIGRTSNATRCRALSDNMAQFMATVASRIGFRIDVASMRCVEDCGGMDDTNLAQESASKNVPLSPKKAEGQASDPEGQFMVRANKNPPHIRGSFFPADARGHEEPLVAISLNEGSEIYGGIAGDAKKTVDGVPAKKFDDVTGDAAFRSIKVIDGSWVSTKIPEDLNNVLANGDKMFRDGSGVSYAVLTKVPEDLNNDFANEDKMFRDGSGVTYAVLTKVPEDLNNDFADGIREVFRDGLRLSSDVSTKLPEDVNNDIFDGNGKMFRDGSRVSSAVSTIVPVNVNNGRGKGGMLGSSYTEDNVINGRGEKRIIKGTNWEEDGLSQDEKLKKEVVDQHFIPASDASSRYNIADVTGDSLGGPIRVEDALDVIEELPSKRPMGSEDTRDVMGEMVTGSPNQPMRESSDVGKGDPIEPFGEPLGSDILANQTETGHDYASEHGSFYVEGSGENVEGGNAKDDSDWEDRKAFYDNFGIGGDEENDSDPWLV